MRPGKISIIPALITLFAILAFLTVLNFAITKPPAISNTNRLVACTEEAKLCPDGSYVGRTGPNCAFAECPATITNQNANSNTSLGTEDYPKNVAASYLTGDRRADYYSGTQFGLREDFVAPFNLEAFYYAVTEYGILFWKKGETRIADIAGFQDFEYENGVSPEFRWFDFRTTTFTDLPTVAWKTGDEQFDRVYAVFTSTSEPRVVIEVGEYDINDESFGPGLVESQPVKTRGLEYHAIRNEFDPNDPITAYHQATNGTSTLFRGFIYDSEYHTAVSVPGGEGCGAYSTIVFVNLIDQTSITVPSPEEMDENNYGGYDYDNTLCNPRNGRDPDGSWLVLYGKVKGSNTTVFRLFQSRTKDQVLKATTIDSYDLGDYPKSWDTSKTWPVITMNSGRVADFNQ